MKKILLIVVLLPLFSFAQDIPFEMQWGLAKVDSTYKIISLPKIWVSDLNDALKVGKYSRSSYTVTHDSTYRKIFHRYPKDSLPVFDFNKEELLVHVSCRYCVGNATYENQPRHRNACSYTFFWFLRKKENNTKVHNY